MSHSITQKNINSGSITELKGPFSADERAAFLKSPQGDDNIDEQAPPKDPSVIYDKVGLID